MTARPTGTGLAATHWGTYQAHTEGGRLVAVTPWPGDPDPSPIGQSLVGAVDGDLRVARPAFRQGWLEGDRTHLAGRRGAEPFVELPWDEALDRVAAELDRVRREVGNAGIYAGSYGWASAGRFHHAQGQIHRFLNTIGGYTGSTQTYSYAAAEILLPHVIGSTDGLVAHHSTWEQVADHGRLVVAFGGLPRRNAQVQAGALGRHEARGAIQRAASRGVRFITVSPVGEDAPDGIVAEWLRLRPNTDAAFMLALAHVLIVEGLHDEAFLHSHCTGFPAVRAYVLGEGEGQAKGPDWAGSLCGVAPGVIVALARAMAAQRTTIMVNWALQRADGGEQPYWMAITLAAMLGQIGLPGGGFGWPSLPQGRNPVAAPIPVARVADMLLDPGGRLQFNGRELTYPDIRLVYWAGGNPFHHHQDLNRLAEAWQRPETVVVHEPYWTATARRADIVLPVTTTLERNDIAFASRESVGVAMKRFLDPLGEARDDYAIFAALAARLGTEAQFTEGRDADAWLRVLYEEARTNAGARGLAMPPFDAFWDAGLFDIERPPPPPPFLAAFRADPEQHRLQTPSGRIELFSATIALFGYDDCPGHAVCREPREWLGAAGVARHPLHLLSPQPADKLHSQYDQGSVSRAAKVAGRAALRINPADAASRGIRARDVVEVFNDRGACLAGAVLTEGVMPGVVQLPTGAWFDPTGPTRPGSIEKHGNPNVLTADRGTSRLAQAPSCNSVLVQVALPKAPPPPVTAFQPPLFTAVRPSPVRPEVDDS